MIRNLSERSSHKSHDRPATQHSQQVDDNNQEGNGSRLLPGPEIDRDDVRVLNGKDTDDTEKSQEDGGLNESHGDPLVLKG
jgi:hypothetical protein